MALKMSGYICDKCSIVVIPRHLITDAFAYICQIGPLTIRIYCVRCGDIVKRAEITMGLKDVGEKDKRKNQNEI